MCRGWHVTVRGMAGIRVGPTDCILYYSHRTKMDYCDVLWWAEYPEPGGPQQRPPEDTDALLEWVTCGQTMRQGRPWLRRRATGPMGILRPPRTGRHRASGKPWA